MVVGAGLALVGTALQAAARNPLADPYLFGVSSGAAFGAVLVIVHAGDVLGTATLPLAAFMGAMTAISSASPRSAPVVNQRRIVRGNHPTKT